MRKSEAAGKSDGARDSARRAKTAFWLPLTVTALTLAVFVGAILLMAGQVRQQLHAGILHEDGEVLYSAVKATQDDILPEESAQDRLVRVFQASDFRAKEVFGVRIFDGDGKFVIGWDKNLVPRDLSEAEFSAVQRGEVLGTFEPEMDLSTQFRNSEMSAVGPVLSVKVPLENTAAEFLLDGERVRAKLLAVDRDVRRYSAGMSLIGATLIGLGLAWAFSRLNRTNALLAKRSADLLRANHELTLAAKTSAVGAVAAHLIHGLKNPLTGLQLLVSNQLDDAATAGPEWRIAADAARRMQVMIGDIVRIMQEDAGDNYEISVAEMLELLQAKVSPMAREKGVGLSTRAKFTGKLANREANLVILALTNLIQNAVQASSAGQQVQVAAESIEGSICFDVSDEAGGIPESVRDVLFTPCFSTKPGGTGIGLAITKQLVSHMGGLLEMVETSARGTRFRLTIPANVLLNAGAGQAPLEESAVA